MKKVHHTIEWASGLFEGEGSIVVRDRSSEYGRSHGRSICISLVMTDEDVVRRFHDVVGLGLVTGPYVRKGPAHWKPAWRWSINNGPDACLLLKRLMPYFGSRRNEKAIEAIHHMKDTRSMLGPVSECKNGHQYNKENTYIYQKTGKRSCRKCRAVNNKNSRLRLNKE